MPASAPLSGRYQRCTGRRLWKATGIQQGTVSRRIVFMVSHHSLLLGALISPKAVLQNIAQCYFTKSWFFDVHFIEAISVGRRNERAWSEKKISQWTRRRYFSRCRGVTDVIARRSASVGRYPSTERVEPVQYPPPWVFSYTIPLA